jgi:hypothetical protein
VLTYDYDDTAYHIQSDHTDQIVSRNHRCLVERDGREVFQYAETLQQQESVPILEDVSSLLEALLLRNERTGSTQQILQGVQSTTHERCQEGQEYKARLDTNMPLVRSAIQDQEQGEGTPFLFSQVLRGMESNRPNYTATPQDNCQQGQAGMDRAGQTKVSAEDERREESSLEGRSNLLQDTRQLYRREVCTLSSGISGDGTQGWLRDGTSLDSSTSYRASIAESGSGTPQRSQSIKQRSDEPTTLCQQSGSQTIRASRYTRSDLATVTPIHYKGVVWCVRVPSGAFIARRNGKVFITGNSGFPKSHNISKAIDKHLGAEREVIGVQSNHRNRPYTDNWDKSAQLQKGFCLPGQEHQGNLEDITAPATPEALAHEGEGTALKPASEHWWLCRKPLSEPTIAENVLKWGTGSLFIDKTRIGTEQTKTSLKDMTAYHGNQFGKPGAVAPITGYKLNPQGRWPANVVMSHSVFCVQVGTKQVKPSNGSGTVRRSNGVSTSAEGWGNFGKWKPGSSDTGYADSEGYETVEDWECSDDCPIKLLGEQSGTLKSGGKAVYAKEAGREKGFLKDSPPMASYTEKGEGTAARYFHNFSPDPEPFLYAAKPSRRERNAGCEELPAIERVNGNKWTDQDYRVISGERSASRESKSRQNGNTWRTYAMGLSRCYRLSSWTSGSTSGI